MSAELITQLETVAAAAGAYADAAKAAVRPLIRDQFRASPTTEDHARTRTAGTCATS
jgi:N-acetyl-gamma-glutamylphosphate reductase